eukprot:scaffold41_cov100-Skeletonema_dohrnii-CCMP3373.AAC.7
MFKGTKTFLHWVYTSYLLRKKQRRWKMTDAAICRKKLGQMIWHSYLAPPYIESKVAATHHKATAAATWLFKHQVIIIMRTTRLLLARTTRH